MVLMENSDKTEKKMRVASGKLVIVSAPSGAGKTTIVKHLLSLPLGLEFSVSATSRRPRVHEKEGKDYYFIGEDEFRRKIEEGAFVEWEEVYPGIFYGTLISEVERIFSGGKNAIFDVDVIGGLRLKKLYGNQSLAVFISPPSIEALRERLRMRSSETEDKINLRCAKATYELSFAVEFDRIILNDQLEKALPEAEKVVRDFLGLSGSILKNELP